MSNNIFFGPLDGRRPARFRRRTIAFRSIFDTNWNVGTVGVHVIVTRDGGTVPFNEVRTFVVLDEED